MTDRAEQELDALLALARGAEPAALSPLELRRRAREAVERASRPRRDARVAWWFALASAAVFTLFGAWTIQRPAGTRVVVDRHDAPLRLTLGTGDVLLAMPGSELVVEADAPAAREVRLTRGTALFGAAKLGKGQRFAVRAGDVTVRVLGTVFSVAHGQEGVEVRVFEGRVAVNGVEVRAPGTWRQRGHASTRDARLDAEAARLVALREPAHTVAPRAVATSPAPSAEAQPSPPMTSEATPPRAPSAHAARDPLADAERSADALNAVGRSCEAVDQYAWLAAQTAGAGGLAHEEWVFAAAQRAFHSCHDPARARQLLERHAACDDQAALRERATALLVDVLLALDDREGAISWARRYLARERSSATSARMRALTR